LKKKKKYFLWGAQIIVNVLKFNSIQVDRPRYNMPKHKNGKVMQSGFKAQGLLRSKDHLDFHEK
jgi:hypothetical protein